MKTRKILLLSAIALLLCVYLVQFFTRGGESKRTIALGDTPDSIVISKADGISLSITKEGDAWLLGDKKYPADPSLVQGIVSALDQIKVLGKVSLSGDLERYSLSEAGRLTVTAAKGGKTLRTVAVGKNAVTGRQSYALIDDSKDVLLVSGNLNDTFGKGIDALRKKEIWSMPADSISRIDVAGSGSGVNFSLAKSAESVWAVAAPDRAKSFALDSNTVASWAQNFANVRAESFPADGVVPGAALWTFLVTGGGKESRLIVHSKDGDARYLCSSSESPFAFYLSSASVERLMKAYTAFANK